MVTVVVMCVPAEKLGLPARLAEDTASIMYSSRLALAGVAGLGGSTQASRSVEDGSPRARMKFGRLMKSPSEALIAQLPAKGSVQPRTRRRLPEAWSITSSPTTTCFSPFTAMAVQVLDELGGR